MGKGSAMNTLYIMHHTTPSRSPHNALHSPSIYIYLFIYIYIWYVRIPYIHPALFVRDSTFHVMLLQIIVNI